MKYSYLFFIVISLRLFANVEIYQDKIETLEAKINKEISSITEEEVKIENNIESLKKEKNSILVRATKIIKILKNENTPAAVTTVALNLDSYLKNNESKDTSNEKIAALKTKMQSYEDRIKTLNEQHLKHENLLAKYDFNNQIEKYKEKFLDSTKTTLEEESILNILKSIFVYESLIRNYDKNSPTQKRFLSKLKLEISNQLKKLKRFNRSKNYSSLKDVKQNLFSLIKNKIDENSTTIHTKLNNEYNNVKYELSQISQKLTIFKNLEKELDTNTKNYNSKQKSLSIIRKEYTKNKARIKTYRSELREYKQRIEEINKILKKKNPDINTFNKLKEKLKLISLKIIFYESNVKKDLISIHINNLKNKSNSLKGNLSKINELKNLKKSKNSTESNIQNVQKIRTKYKAIKNFLSEYQDCMKENMNLDKNNK